MRPFKTLFLSIASAAAIAGCDTGLPRMANGGMGGTPPIGGTTGTASMGGTAGTTPTGGAGGTGPTGGTAGIAPTGGAGGTGPTGGTAGTAPTGPLEVHTGRLRIDPSQSWWGTADAKATAGGSATVTTTTECLSDVSGFTLGMTLMFFNANGELIGSTPIQQYGVDSPSAVFLASLAGKTLRSKRTDTFEATVPAETRRIGVLLWHDGKNRILDDLGHLAADLKTAADDLVKVGDIVTFLTQLGDSLAAVVFS